MKKNYLALLGLILLTNLFSFVLLPSPLAATSVQRDIEEQLTNIGDVYGNGSVNQDTLGETIAKIIKIALGLLGIIFIALIIYAGFLWLTSAGNEEQISKAKKIMAAAFIGTIIVLAAYIITIFVVNTLTEATGTN